MVKIHIGFLIAANDGIMEWCCNVRNETVTLKIASDEDTAAEDNRDWKNFVMFVMRSVGFASVSRKMTLNNMEIMNEFLW